jgi:acyl-CoA synthetase (AMP-forming)/AMP-acid ligase II
MSRSVDTIISRLETVAAEAPEQAFCIHYSGDGSETISYRRLLEGARAAAGRFQSWGCEPGDIALIFLKHEPELYFSFIGAMLAGIVPSFMPYPNPKQSHDLFWRGHAALLERIEPRLLVVSPELIEQFRQFLPAYADRMRSAAGIAGEGGAAAAPVERQADDVAFLQHSSGTTALKKGVMLSHGAVLRQTDAYARAIGFSGADITASWLPLYHDMGLIACLMLTVTSGATLLSLDPFEWVGAPATLLDVIERHRATFCWLPNFAFNHLAASVRGGAGRDLSSVRAFINCSEPCRAESFEVFARRFAECGVTPEQLQVCYAMAESVFAVTQTPVGLSPRILSVDRDAFEAHGRVEPGEGIRLLSCGSPIEGIGLRIVGDDGGDLPPGRIGEVAIAAPFLFDGYYRQPSLTGLKLRDGWYYSGDMGCLVDEELYITGRKDDLIIAYGRNYYAHEIEAVASGVDDVLPGRCVAFAVPSPMAGTQQTVLMAETRAEDGAPLVRQLREAVLASTGLALTQIVLRPPGTLVKTTSGKISREANRTQFLNARSGVPAQ